MSGSPSASEQARVLEFGLSSGDWTDPAEHQKLAEVKWLSAASSEDISMNDKCPTCLPYVGCAWHPRHTQDSFLVAEVFIMQALAEHLQAGVAQQDGIKQLRALLGTDESLPGNASSSAGQALQKAVAGIAEKSGGGAAMGSTNATSAREFIAAEGLATGRSQGDIAESLAAELSAAAQAAATGAILSSVQVWSDQPAFTSCTSLGLADSQYTPLVIIPSAAILAGRATRWRMKL